MNLSVAKSIYSTLLEIVHSMMGQGESDAVDLPAVLGKLFSGIRLKMRFHPSTHTDGCLGDVTDMLKGATHGQTQALKALGKDTSSLTGFNVDQVPFKNWTEAKEQLKNFKNNMPPFQELRDQVPLVEDFVMALKNYGLQNSTTAVVVNQCVLSMHSKGEGLKEMFEEAWGIMTTD